MLYTILGLAILCLPLLYILGRRDEKKVRRDWELLLTPRGEQLYRTIETRVTSEMQLATITYDEAFSVRELGSASRALHILLTIRGGGRHKVGVRCAATHLQSRRRWNRLRRLA